MNLVDIELYLSKPLDTPFQFNLFPYIQYFNYRGKWGLNNIRQINEDIKSIGFAFLMVINH